MTPDPGGSTPGPVFIGGLDRTGTSLIYALLASHPRIAMSRRTNWWTFFYDRFGDLGDDANLDRCLATMRRYRRHRRLDPDWDRLRADFVRGERGYARLFALMEEQHAARLGRPRWGDKSLHTERYADRVFEHFPNARIIHMVRDPRDRYASVLKRWKKVRGGAGASTAAWIASIRLGERNRVRHPDGYRLLRYEDLASRAGGDDARLSVPSSVSRTSRGCSPWRAPPTSGMRAATAYAPHAAGTISTSSIGRYRAVLAPSDVAFVQGAASPEMRRHGYATEPVPMQGSRG